MLRAQDRQALSDESIRNFLMVGPTVGREHTVGGHGSIRPLANATELSRCRIRGRK
jgi:hypothetical protein